MEAKRLTGPLFWLHGSESKERLESYVQKTAESGNGSFTAESRPHRDWLGEGWYRDLAICLEAAKQHDLEMWIFDEKWWPSQMIGGKVPAAVRHEGARGRNGGRGRAAGRSTWKATAASATWRRWPGAWPTAERSTATA